LSSPTGNDGDRAKHRARGEGGQRRAGVMPWQRAGLSAQAAARALELPEVGAARAVLAYAAMPGEIDPAPLVHALRERGARVAYPRVCGPGAMTLHWASDDALEPGFCGIAEPAADAEDAAPDEFDLAIVPGVAFDAACERLGRGGGFYDRLLPAITGLTVGLAFDEQIVECLPREEHDMPVDVVVTPSRVIRRR
jgi:5-formyltetrahydrofolate cyclo-ligase